MYSIEQVKAARAIGDVGGCRELKLFSRLRLLSFIHKMVEQDLVCVKLELSKWSRCLAWPVRARAESSSTCMRFRYNAQTRVQLVRVLRLFSHCSSLLSGSSWEVPFFFVSASFEHN